MSNHDSIHYARDLSEHPLDEPRNRRGQTLGEYIETLRNVHDALKGDMFFHMACKRKAKDVATHEHHDKAIARISKALSTARRRASEYGINLS